jgi:hypothetical protein
MVGLELPRTAAAMNSQSPPSLNAVRPLLRPVDDRLLGWIGRLFGVATLAGLGLFGVYIALRASGTSDPRRELGPGQGR